MTLPVWLAIEHIFRFISYRDITLTYYNFYFLQNNNKIIFEVKNITDVKKI
jgi:hypothetical protein